MRTTYDKIFVKNIEDILKNGTEYKSRAIWEEDGQSAKCIKLFGLVNRYNSDYENEVPIGTIRKFPIKNCIDEILWIWQKKSNNIKDLKSHIWDSWADVNGSIGKAYGYQVGTKLRKVSHEEKRIDSIGDSYYENISYFADQTDYVLHELKYNPFNRRILTNLYSVEDTSLMGLEPCCYSCTWNVTKKDNKLYLNLLLNQRSQDMIVANNWNVFQYWILQNMFAHVSGMEVGELVHVIADAHIYDRHIDIANHMLNLYYDNPTDQIDSNEPYIEFNHHNNFYDYTIYDFTLKDYSFSESIRNIPVAV